MQSKKPNLYIIGVQKSGTTSFYNWLAKNKKIVTGYNLKDKHTLFEERPKEIYAKKFNESGKYYLDASVNYFFYDRKFIDMTSYSEKVLLFLRNPIDRALSAYNYNYMKGREKRDLREAFDYKWTDKKEFELNYYNSNFTYVEHSLYYQRLKNISDKFGSNLRVYILEEITKDEDHFVNDISSFLKVKLNNNFKKDNQSKDIRSYHVSKFINNNNSFKNFLKKFLNEKKGKKIAKKINQLNYRKSNNQKNKIDSDMYNDLLSFYKKDIQMISDLLDKDLMKIWFNQSF